MSIYLCPANCTQVTLQSAGAKVPDANRQISFNGSADRASVDNRYAWGPNSVGVLKNKQNGTVQLFVPDRVQEMTLSGVSYAATTVGIYTVLDDVNMAAATAAIASMKDSYPCLLRLVAA